MHFHKQEWLEENLGGLTIFRSPLLNRYHDQLAHAFSTRLGGESKQPFHHFNLDKRAAYAEVNSDVDRNRIALCQALSLQDLEPVTAGQIHQNNISVISKCNIKTDVDQIEELKNSDALVTNDPATPLMLLFADCVPIVLFDQQCRALAVVHAGWRGTALSIARAAVQKMVEIYGSKRANIKAAIGPAIESCCYPTNEDIAKRLGDTVSPNNGLILRGKDGNEPRPDLKAINAAQLMQCGITEIDINNQCTACKPYLFYSFRQSGGITGRQCAIACLK